jgi:hypothetical protein
MQIPESYLPSFKVALYQFILPVVPLGAEARMDASGLLTNIDHTILNLQDLESTPPQPTRLHLQNPGHGMCKNVHQVQRPPLPPKKTNLIQHQPIVPLNRPPSGSTARRKRTKKTEDESGMEDSSPIKSRKRTSKTRHFDRLKKLRKF